MMRMLFGALVVLLITVSGPAYADQFRWKNVGGDPCNPKAGCTLAWALDNAVSKAGWPQDVATVFESRVREFPAQNGMICSGWTGWMTAGLHTAKFEADTIADWPSGHCEPMISWKIVSGIFEYHLIKVHKCKNWGGWKQPATIVAMPEPAPDRIPLGVIPVISCE